MTELQLNSVVEAVLAELALPRESGSVGPLIPLEASARHVHLTKEAVARLFGPGETLRQVRALSQPGEFLSEQRVKIVTPKGQIENVAVLGPARAAVQAELSFTDCRALGIAAPVRLSGDLRGASDVILVGPAGIFEAPGSAIAAQNHIHMTPDDAAQFGLRDGQTVRLRAETERPVTFERVQVRVRESFALAAHIDFDEANACGYVPGAMARLLPCKGMECTTAPTPSLDIKVLTEEIAKTLRGPVILRKGTIITPAARDVLNYAKLTITFI